MLVEGRKGKKKGLEMIEIDSERVVDWDLRHP